VEAHTRRRAPGAITATAPDADTIAGARAAMNKKSDQQLGDKLVALMNERKRLIAAWKARRRVQAKIEIGSMN
jgi:hypothetical protein